VFVSDRNGIEHHVNRVGPGGTLGEMALLTGEPASATVRAASELEVLVLSEAEFRRAAATLPRIYENVAAVLSRKLYYADRRLLDSHRDVLAWLVDQGAPPLLGYALACSVAWHSRKPTLLLVLCETPSPELVAIAGAADASTTGAAARAYVRLIRRSLPAGSVAQIVDELPTQYAHVLVQTRTGTQTPVGLRRIRLAPFSAEARDAPGDLLGHTLYAWMSAPGLPRPDRGGCLTVPPLTPGDQQAMAEGLLPSNSGAGAALGWIARDLTGLKVGLALGGGGTKGYAHLGVLHVLERAGVPIDYLAGTSAGAIIGCLRALGHSLDAIADILDKGSPTVFHPTLPRKALLSDVSLRRFIRRIVGDARIEELRIPLAIVAADIATGTEVTFTRGLLWPAVLASMSIPGVFPPRAIGSFTLVDGGVINPVPSDVASDMGANVVLGVNLNGRQAAGRVDLLSVVPSGPIPSILETITRTLDVMQGRIASTGRTATIVIEPMFPVRPGWGLRRFREGRQFIQIGEVAAEAALARVSSVLPWIVCDRR
jgi:NTE family protein